jgi:ABC-2 type transport system ATP-binding protein
VSFTLEPGKIVGLLGPNGSGKTTLIKIINGLLTTTEGEVLINGSKPGPETKAIVSYLPDATYLSNSMRVDEVLDFFEDFYADFDKARAREMLSQLEISPSAKLKSLSKGTKEKVQLIVVMSRQAKLYVLDEPIGGVDPAARDYILRTIITNYSPESTVIIATHLISDIESVLDEVLFIDRGTIVLQDSVDHIRETRGQSVDEMFRQVFAC